MAGFETAIAHENEIMKAQDVAFGYDAAISNIGAALKAILGNHAGDYVIGGFVKPFGTDTLQIAVEAAFIFCQSTGLCAAETDMTAPISLESADATFDRIDVVQVHAFKTEFSQQSRMFNDPISGIKRLRTVPTKKRIQFDVQIKKGANGSESAPKTDEGFVKLAEIRIPAGTQNLTAEMIRNVEARKSGGVNTLWTEDKTRTFNPGSLTDVFSTFLIAHNEDGSHKAKAIKKEHIDFGTSGDQIKGSDIPTGKSVRVHKKDFSQIADLTSVITALAESSNALPAYANDILSRYSYVSILPVAASTAPIDIKGGGEKTIDGVACKADMTVFLKDQTDARENGLYIVKAGAWARAAGFTEGAAFTDKLILIPAGTVNKGKIFYLASPVNTLGQDTLDFKASALSPYALANTVMTRDKDGRAKVAAPNAADDIARKAEVDAEARTRADAVHTEAQARADADFAEKNARIEADRILADTRMTRMQCEDIARSAVGKIPAAGQGDSTDKDKNKGLGLVKTANRAPNMQEASKNESWAASPNWVFNLITGNCEAELKKHIINAMRSGVESDPGVFCYRGTIKAEELNKTKTSGIYTVSYGTYGGALLVFNASGSVGIVQFLKNNWLVDTPWQYRNAIDGRLDRWNTWRSIATSEEVASHTNDKSNPHGVTKEQLGLGNVDNTRDNEKFVRHAESADRASVANAVKDYNSDDGYEIQIGFSGASLKASDVKYLAAYDGRKIKDLPQDEARKWLGIDNLSNTADAEKSVQRADSAAEADVAVAVQDYGDTSKTVKIGYLTESVKAEEIQYLAAYKNGNHIKDASKDAVKEWLAINNIDNTRDNEKSVRHAESADRADRADRADSASSASVANAVKDYEGGIDIQIGFAGASLTAADVNYLAAFSGGKIKDIHKDEVKKLLGVDTVSIENAGWKACIRPCANGVELVILGGDGGEMKKQQLWTRIAGGVMSLFVLGSITSCGGMYQGNTGAVKNSWKKMNSTTSALLRSVACNGNTWIAVGMHGKCLRSTDDGRTWDAVSFPVYGDIKAVACNDNRWIATSHNGTIIKSFDNGVNWNTGDSTNLYLNSIASNGETWIAVGEGGTIFSPDKSGAGFTDANGDVNRGRGRITKGQARKIREQCREILKKPDSDITEADKQILSQYVGAGGTGEDGASNSGVLYEFYTPRSVVSKVWQLVDKYNPRQDKSVIEPSGGIGRFAEGRAEKITLFELEQESARIAHILHPDAEVVQGAFQEHFLKNKNGRFSKDFKKFDVAVGNLPYGAYTGKYKGLGEGKDFKRYDSY